MEFKRVKGKETGNGRCSWNLRGLREKREERRKVKRWIYQNKRKVNKEFVRKMNQYCFRSR